MRVAGEDTHSELPKELGLDAELSNAFAADMTSGVGSDRPSTVGSGARSKGDTRTASDGGVAHTRGGDVNKEDADHSSCRKPVGWAASVVVGCVHGEGVKGTSGVVMGEAGRNGLACTTREIGVVVVEWGLLCIVVDCGD